MRAAAPVAVVSVSMDLGAGRRGVDMGPSALRLAGLTTTLQSLGRSVVEMGTVHAREPEALERMDPRARFLPEIADVCAGTRDLVARALSDGCVPLVLGGDHSLSMGSVAAVAAFHRERGERIGVLWVDAHTDFNTPESTPSGNIHGMSLAVLAGGGPEELRSLSGAVPCVRPEDICVLGARSIDPGERERIRALGIRVFTMTEIDERGIGPCVGEALDRVTDGTAGFHLSFDLDGLDPMVAPGVGTPVPGGLTYREGHLVCEKASASGRLLSVELVELNPVLDQENRTGRVGVGLLASALGQTIL